MTFGNIIIIGIHAILAWVLIEIFVNHAHKLSRIVYVILHYIVVVSSFAVLFFFYHRIFNVGSSPFFVTAVGMGFILLFEYIIFRYLYIGERWFLNFVDWILPFFLATSTIYAVMSL